MRETGLEPARYYYHQALNLARLPIPPFPQRCEPKRSFGPSLDHGPLSHSADSTSFCAVDDRSQAAFAGCDEISRGDRTMTPNAASPPMNARLQATSPTGIQR